MSEIPHSGRESNGINIVIQHNYTSLDVYVQSKESSVQCAIQSVNEESLGGNHSGQKSHSQERNPME